MLGPVAAKRALRARRSALGAAGLLLGAGCLESLDESKLLDQPGGAGTAGTASSDGAAAGSGAGSGGTAGDAGDSDSGGSSGAGAASGGSGGQPATFVPHDAARYPVRNLQADVPAPVIIAADSTRVFRSTRNSEPAALVAQDIAGGPGMPIHQGLARPQQLSTGGSSDHVYIAQARAGGTGAGSLLRIGKIAGDAGRLEEEVTTLAPIELPVGIFAASDGFAYVSANASSAGTAALLRFAFAAGQNAEVLYASETGGDIGGDVTKSGDCAYWIGNGNVWVIPASGAMTRANALSAPIADAVALASDLEQLYVGRLSGEIWQRALSPAACDGSGSAEQKIAEGFTGIGGVIAYNGTVAWTAKNYTQSGGGGVFTTPVGGGTITQIAPGEGDPEALDQGASDVVFTTATGRIRSVPKTPR